MVSLHSKTLIKTETKIDNHLLSWFKIHHYTPLWIFSVDDEMPSIIQMCFYFYLRWNVFCLKIFNIVSLAYIFEVLVIKYCKVVLWSCIFGFISDSWLFFFGFSLLKIWECIWFYFIGIIFCVFRFYLSSSSVLLNLRLRLLNTH